MENYKIKLNDESESKEAQELFFELGYKFSLSDEDKLIRTSEVFNFPYFLGAFEDGQMCFMVGKSEHQELTITQLRDLVAQSKNEQGLISGADALRAIADGKEVEVYMEIPNKLPKTKGWVDASICSLVAFAFISPSLSFKFRLKPRTIKIELEIPACGKNYKHGQLIWILNSLEPKEYCSVILDESDELPAYWWETEEEIKKVVAALRRGIKG